MNDLFYFIIFWILSGVTASIVFYITGISRVSKKEFIVTIFIGALGGHITWIAPLIYGKQTNEGVKDE